VGKKTERNGKKEVSFRARDETKVKEYMKEYMRPCVYAKHFGLCAQNQSTITGSINHNYSNKNNNIISNNNNNNNNSSSNSTSSNKYCNSNSRNCNTRASFSTDSGAGLSCTMTKVVAGCAMSVAEPTIGVIP